MFKMATIDNISTNHATITNHRFEQLFFSSKFIEIIGHLIHKHTIPRPKNINSSFTFEFKLIKRHLQ